ncbi:CDP-alcohol phosphatidyltransferase family protein [Intestinibacter sp.]|uniref:CDP-alcohol phosphatidyltransferase family protein n=1 Tax=Intestinibacter sp. TaxID=1965304 RepID=UPI003FA540DD
MRYIPNLLSLARIILSLFLIFLYPMKLYFLLVYIFCGITDILDGFIARKINATSELGSKLDSFADMIIIFVILFKFIPIMNLNLFMIVWLICVTILKSLCILVVFIRFNQFGMVHTYMNKITGSLIFIYPILNYFTSSKFYIFIIFIFASITAIEEILIDFTMKSLELDKKSYFK